MSGAVACPICYGVGQVDAGFYTRTSETWFSSGGTEACRSCAGKGWVVVNDDKVDDINYDIEQRKEVK